MKRPVAIPDRESIRGNTPLRLDVAAALAFPNGSMTASGLRNEWQRGNLRVELIANKLFTTLDDIEDMRRKCARPNRRDSSCERQESDKKQHGLLSTSDGKSAQARAQASAQKLKSRSANTSQKTAGQVSGTVIPIKS
jgi:hypothetical protein